MTYTRPRQCYCRSPISGKGSNQSIGIARELFSPLAHQSRRAIHRLLRSRLPVSPFAPRASKAPSSRRYRQAYWAVWSYKSIEIRGPYSGMRRSRKGMRTHILVNAGRRRSRLCWQSNNLKTEFLDPNFICYLAPAIPLDPQSCSRSAQAVPTFPRDSTFEGRTQYRNGRR